MGKRAIEIGTVPVCSGSFDGLPPFFWPNQSFSGDAAKVFNRNSLIRYHGSEERGKRKMHVLISAVYNALSSGSGRTLGHHIVVISWYHRKTGAGHYLPLIVRDAPALLRVGIALDCHYRMGQLVAEEYYDFV